MTHAFDPLPLPAPAGLLHALLLAAFLAHVVPMTVTLGGSFWSLLAARRHPALARAIAASLPSWTAFTVSTGVAALLFLQVLYGQFFFPASVTIAWTWLAVPALVLGGYALLYLRASRPADAPALGLLAALLFTAVSFVQSTQMTLMLHPELHRALQTGDPRGLVLPLGLPALFPRWLHLLAGAVGTSALWPMWLAAGAVRRGEDGARAALDLAAKGFSAATGVAMLLGLLFLAALPGRALAAFRGPVAGLGLLAAIGLSVLATVLAKRAREAEDAPRAVARCAAAVLALLSVMVVLRDVVRRGTLGPALDSALAPAAPQWGAIALFAALLAAGAATVAWAVRAVWRGEAA